MKKYIVNDLPNQTLTGNLEMTGNLIVNGDLTINAAATYSIAAYKALLTQTEAVTGTSLSDFNEAFVIGEAYTIAIYQPGDDFSNIGVASSGDMNTSGCVFTAIGSYPANFSNGSTIVSSGSLSVEVLENTLGFDINWAHAPMGGFGYYVGVNNTLGPIYNCFPRNRTIVKTQEKNVFGYTGEQSFQFWTEVDSFIYKDSSVVLRAYDMDSGMEQANLLYYTPIEIAMKRDIDTTPVAISGTVSGAYPLVNTTVRFLRNGVDIYHAGTGQTSDDLADMLSTLNAETYTNYFGTYADDGAGGLTLSMPGWLKRQFAEDNLLTFEVYAD